MVGDGVNDAPGAGRRRQRDRRRHRRGAVETANVVLMRSDPLDVAAARKLSRATVRKMKQNLVWASVYSVMAIPIAAEILSRRPGSSCVRSGRRC